MASPSFDYAKVDSSSVEKLICSDKDLAAMDVRLSATFKEAEARTERKICKLLKQHSGDGLKAEMIVGKMMISTNA